MCSINRPSNLQSVSYHCNDSDCPALFVFFALCSRPFHRKHRGSIRRQIIMANALPRVALLVAGCAALASAATITVGDSQGWATGVDYTSWANSKSFSVGDTLGELAS